MKKRKHHQNHFFKTMDSIKKGDMQKDGNIFNFFKINVGNALYIIINSCMISEWKIDKVDKLCLLTSFESIYHPLILAWSMMAARLGWWWCGGLWIWIWGLAMELIVWTESGDCWSSPLELTMRSNIPFSCAIWRQYFK